MAKEVTEVKLFESELEGDDIEEIVSDGEGDS